jgi:hypothetical protein
MTFPENDAEFEDLIIGKVEPQKGGGWIITHGAWGLYVPPTMDNAGLIEPIVGMACRMYGHGIGSVVRGLYFDGRKVFYRTEAEDKEHREIRMYGKDAADWLTRWDAGDSVWTIEMGGLGPGYEQCIHITAAEVLRWFLAEKPDPEMWNDKDGWKADRDRMEPVVMEVDAVKKLGLSGAQWGAAVSIATQLYRRGPRSIMNDDQVKDRHIQVCRVFPG